MMYDNFDFDDDYEADFVESDYAYDKRINLLMVLIFFSIDEIHLEPQNLNRISSVKNGRRYFTYETTVSTHDTDSVIKRFASYLSQIKKMNNAKPVLCDAVVTHYSDTLHLICWKISTI